MCASIFLYLPGPAKGGEVGVPKSQFITQNTLSEPRIASQEPLKPTYADLIGNDYFPGQCVWFVANELKVPAGMGNAIDWLANARADGVPEGTVPRVGAVAWTDSYWLGHVAVVIAVDGDQVEVEEMNFQGPFVTDTRWTNASDWRYIYP